MSSVFSRDYSVTLPLAEKAEGVWIHASDGRKYLDGMGSAGVIGIGHGRTEIYDALAKQGPRVSYVYTASFTHPWQEEFFEIDTVGGAAGNGRGLLRLRRLGSERNGAEAGAAVPCRAQ